MGGFSHFKSNNPFRHTSSSSTNNDDIDNVPPPPGPPPSHRRPGAASSEQEYAPPPGPPPSYTKGKASEHDNDDYTAPPPGPPPPPPPQHDWEQAVPDTSLLPPPPDIFSGWDTSPATNAPEEQAEAGESWCRQYPLTPPMDPDSLEPALRQQGGGSGSTTTTIIIPQLLAPPRAIFASKGGTLVQTGGARPGGTWTVRTSRRGGDCCIIGYPHVYLARRDSPLVTGGRAKTVYFECRVLGGMGRDAGLAVGFTALPYPPFRMPGWHRGSLAVHGDDGHKYVNDRWGGKDFTEPFRRGEVVGIGMVFSPGRRGGGRDQGEGKGSGGAAGGIQVEVFFTRGGRETGRWDMHESLDSEKDLPITGLEGYHDLTVAIGTYGEVGAEVVLDPSQWAFKP